MLKLYSYILLTFLLVGHCFAQSSNPSEFRIWKLNSYNGSVRLMGFYRYQERVLKNIEETSQYPFLSGGVSLYTNSYIAHPQFITLDIGGEYNPGYSQESYTVSPDRSETFNFKKYNINAMLFNGKPMSFGAHTNYSEDFINREYVTSLATESKEWGLKYRFRNKILPINAAYSNRDWNQREIETGRTFSNKERNFQISSSNSFTKLGDRNEIKYNRFEYFREDENSDTTYNKYDNFYLNNNIYFDRGKKYMLRSNINHLNQRGNLNQLRFQMFETVRLKLPSHFVLSGSYDYTNNDQIILKYNQHRLSADLSHRLFSSLTTNANYDRFITHHTSFEEKNTRAGISFNYLKKIPKGTLRLKYNYRKHYQNVASDPNSTIQITNESHVLADGNVELLNNPYVILPSVVVKDEIGVVIYQIDFDYILIERNNGFVEIQRMPGGQIRNNDLISVDYMASQVGSYQFESNSQTFTIEIQLFDRLLELHYTKSTQDYDNIISENDITLNFYDRDILGTRIQLGPFAGGAEMELYNSSIVPYKKMRYFINVNGSVGRRLLLSLNGEITDLLLTETNTDQFFSSLFGKAIFVIKRQSKINLDLGYRKQIGEEIDLDLATSKIEYNQIIRKLSFTVGVEVFKRLYVGEVVNFRGVFFQIDRKF